MKTVEKELGPILAGTISSITQRSIFSRMGGLANTPVHQLTPSDRAAVMQELESSLRLFARGNSGQLIASCAKVLNPVAGGGAGLAAAGVSPGVVLAPKKLPIEAWRPGPRRCASASPNSPP
jgi:hypothetical protein